MARTAQYWQEWLQHGSFPDHRWRPYLQRSALTLKGLSYAPTGAMIAAATTSLPETPGGERNWDYRYSWIRDSTFMLWGLYMLGFEWEANDYFYFIADVAEAEEGDLQIMYGIDGEAASTSSCSTTSPATAAPARCGSGNGAYNQRQNDVWGAVLDSIYLHAKSRDHLPERMWPILKRQVEAALAAWREPDRGIWEVRGEPKHFTSSKLMCWVAADRGARLARLRDDEAMRRALAGRRGRDPRGHLRERAGRARRLHPALRHRGARRVAAADAAGPLPAARRPPHSQHGARDRRRADRGRARAPLSHATRPTTASRARRARSRSARSGSSRRCARSARSRRRAQLLEKLLSYASPLLLYAEEIDPVTGRHLGNFPQAFTHLALINAVMHVIRAEEQLAAEAPAQRDPSFELGLARASRASGVFTPPLGDPR